MKKNGILNSDISRVLSYMGHTDKICIGDCGLPIPEETERIDLAVTLGIPSFIEVLKNVALDMKIEKIYLAEEIKDNNPEILNAIIAMIPNVAVEFINHEDFKHMTRECKAVVRTGENSPYANIILQSACVF